MPIPRFRATLYPPDWEAISNHVRFKRAKGECEFCGRRHLDHIVQVKDGRWFDDRLGLWRGDDGRIKPSPSYADLAGSQLKLVVIAAIHFDNDPTNNDPRNHGALCGRCHLRYDAPYHKIQRHLTYRRRRAIGDLFDGLYPAYSSSGQLIM